MACSQTAIHWGEESINSFNCHFLHLDRPTCLSLGVDEAAVVFFIEPLQHNAFIHNLPASFLMAVKL